MKFIFKISRVVWHLLFQLSKLIIILKFYKNLVKKSHNKISYKLIIIKLSVNTTQKKDNPCWGLSFMIVILFRIVD